jgi:hypothetical protein
MAASAAIDTEKLTPVIRETARSGAVQPASHPSASTAKIAPGASTTSVSIHCKESI